MPLPLPNLDTRRWQDLVDEGRALIPRFAPAWSDQNLHDPGITILELQAWILEGLIFKGNTVADRHRRKFLALAGYPPEPPSASRGVAALEVEGNGLPVAIPAGLVLEARSGSEASARWVPFRVAHGLVAVPGAIGVLHVFDGERLLDRTQDPGRTSGFAAFGDDPAAPDADAPERAPAFYVGLTAPLDAGGQVDLWFVTDPDAPGAGDALRAESEGAREACAPRDVLRPVTPPRGVAWCPAPEDAVPAPPDPAPAPDEAPQHHEVRIAWDYSTASGWTTLDPERGEVDDETRALTLSGRVRVRVPTSSHATGVGARTAPHHYLRVRIVSGRFDCAPRLAHVLLNGAPVVQALPASERVPIAAGSNGIVPIAPGTRTALRWEFDADGRITKLAPAAGGPGVPEFLVSGFQAPAGGRDGWLAIDAELLRSEPGPQDLGRHVVATGLPGSVGWLRRAPVSDGACRVFAAGPGPDVWRTWAPAADLHAAGAMDARVRLEPSSGEVAFGDGVRGRLAPEGAVLLAAYERTSGARGDVPAGAEWRVADDDVNQALAVVADLSHVRVTNPSPLTGGRDAEDVGSAAERAAGSLWAHERLVELATEAGRDSLDGIGRPAIVELPAPERAATTLDFERIALTVPGTCVARARAIAGLDPRVPRLTAPGNVTVVILPRLPRPRPEPTPGLLRAVRRHLLRRRVVGTRLVVVGPGYLDVSVAADVGARPGADPERVRAGVETALRRFFHPLEGGPDGRGWPFGRDVYRTEVLRTIRSAPDVDHVRSLELSAPGRGASCGNLCMPPTWLAASGTHSVRVVAS